MIVVSCFFSSLVLLPVYLVSGEPGAEPDECRSNPLIRVRPKGLLRDNVAIQSMWPVLGPQGGRGSGGI